MTQPYYSGPLRFLNKDNNCSERKLISDWWKEQICMYGTQANYYVYNYQLSAHNGLYGEHTTASYRAPIEIIVALTLNENSVILSQYGLTTEDDATFYIHISSFYTALSSQTAEPKAGDVIELSEYGETRVGGRGGKKFEITSRVDQDISDINPLIGHYVWKVKTKRFEFSYQPGISAEPVTHQVYEDTFAGRLSGYDNPMTEVKQYPGDIDTTSETLFDYEDNGNGDDVYGGY